MLICIFPVLCQPGCLNKHPQMLVARAEILLSLHDGRDLTHFHAEGSEVAQKSQNSVLIQREPFTACAVRDSFLFFLE